MGPHSMLDHFSRRWLAIKMSSQRIPKPNIFEKRLGLLFFAILPQTMLFYSIYVAIADAICFLPNSFAYRTFPNLRIEQVAITINFSAELATKVVCFQIEIFTIYAIAVIIFLALSILLPKSLHYQSFNIKNSLWPAILFIPTGCLYLWNVWPIDRLPRAGLHSKLTLDNNIDIIFIWLFSSVIFWVAVFSLRVVIGRLFAPTNRNDAV